MSDTLLDLTGALRERLRIIGDEESRRHPERHMMRLKTVSERLEQIEQQLGPDTPQQLRHFLRRRSYDKALEFVETLTANTTRRSAVR